MTLRPLGPSVTLTALLRISTPCSMRSRASVENLTSLADMVLFQCLRGGRRRSGGLPGRDRTLDHPQDVGFFHDQEVFAVDLDLGAGPFSKQHAIAGF